MGGLFLKSSAMFTSVACKSTTVAVGTIRTSSSQHVARRLVSSMNSAAGNVVGDGGSGYGIRTGDGSLTAGGSLSRFPRPGVIGVLLLRLLKCENRCFCLPTWEWADAADAAADADAAVGRSRNTAVASCSCETRLNSSSSHAT